MQAYTYEVMAKVELTENAKSHMINTRMHCDCMEKLFIAILKHTNQIHYIGQTQDSGLKFHAHTIILIQKHDRRRAIWRRLKLFRTRR